MAIEFNCPHCQKFLLTEDDKAGRDAKCPGCGERITVPQPSAVAQAEDFSEESEDHFDDFADYDPERHDAYGRVESKPPRPGGGPSPGTKTCPMCGGEVKAAAVRCKHCGEELEPAIAAPGEHERIDAGPILSRSWELYKQQLGICIGGFLVAGLVSVTPVIPAIVVLVLLDAGNLAQNEELIATLVLGGLALAVLCLQTFLTIGLNILLLNVARRRRAAISDVFKGGPYFLRMLGCSILFWLAVIVGALACVVPGVLAALMFWPYVFVLVDEDPPGFGALSRSKEITEGNWGTLFALVLVGGGINILAGLVCGAIGQLFTMPFVMLVFAVAYDEMRGGVRLET